MTVTCDFYLFAYVYIRIIMRVLHYLPIQVECSKLLGELLQDLDSQFEMVLNSKSIHDCLFNPQNVTNTLCQDYFLLIGRLSNSNEGTAALKKTLIFER